MIHWSTALLTFWTLLVLSAIRTNLKSPHESADAATAKLFIAVVFIETPWLIYLICW